MNYRIIGSEYETRIIPPVIPSKGNLTRDINPDTVPYTLSEFYRIDEYFPKEPIELHEPFILRDFRGITVQFNPFQYNSRREELKVYKKVAVEVYADGPGRINVKTRDIEGISKDFSDIDSLFFSQFSIFKV